MEEGSDDAVDFWKESAFSEDAVQVRPGRVLRENGHREHGKDDRDEEEHEEDRGSEEEESRTEYRGYGKQDEVGDRKDHAGGDHKHVCACRNEEEEGDGLNRNDPVSAKDVPSSDNALEERGALEDHGVQGVNLDHDRTDAYRGKDDECYEVEGEEEACWNAYGDRKRDGDERACSHENGEREQVEHKDGPERTRANR